MKSAHEAWQLRHVAHGATLNRRFMMYFMTITRGAVAEHHALWWAHALTPPIHLLVPFIVTFAALSPRVCMGVWVHRKTISTSCEEVTGCERVSMVVCVRTHDAYGYAVGRVQIAVRACTWIMVDSVGSG